MRHLLFTILTNIAICTTTTSGLLAQSNYSPLPVAHRGCWFTNQIPENSIAAIRTAKRYGYKAIECDVKYTKDSILVIMHDGTINRTMRKASDYSSLTTPINISDLTWAELRQDYVLTAEEPKLRTPVPTLEELLLACKKENIIPMLHSQIYESYSLAQKIMGNQWICFTEHDSLAVAARKISDCLILVDPQQDTIHTLERLQAIGGHCGISTMKKELLTESFCKKLRDHGYEIQSSIFKTPDEVQALHNGASILLTDFSLLGCDIKPVDSWNLSHFKSSKRLKSHETISMEGDSTRYGGLILKIRFIGALEVTVNGNRHYPLIHPTSETVAIGVRYTDDKPTIKITAKDDTKITSLEAQIFEF
ncbi:glycerophosphodiester phosphodiesterase [Alistipes indistinctus]|jgi:hypothetical protein|uniref:glycerophosphodiester phosphodiesterase n=1 Tax=Alistipes indistinctus TaxID=626932 RepID=UPI00122EBDCB|nr:glycerophosphodiester phosphodiesterase family protein [Alistipes indistinctus]KAA3144372.1 glycerophosphodiester phosphodiesterase family protein [Alistipes indistinctus]